MAVKHKFTVPGTDDADPNTVSPSHWNDDHNFVPLSIIMFNSGGTAQAFTNAGAAAQEYVVPRSRNHLDLTYASQFRLIVQGSVVGVTSKTRLEYSTNQSTWLDAAATSGAGDCATPTVANTITVGPWADFAAGAKAAVYLRLVMLGGNTTEDPAIFAVHLQVR